MNGDDQYMWKLDKKRLMILRDWQMLKIDDLFISYNSRTKYIVTDKGEHFVQFKALDGHTGYLYCMPIDAADYQMFPFEKVSKEVIDDI